jgi:hypothetical protein
MHTIHRYESIDQKPGPIERARTVGHTSHATQTRIDDRVRDILARRAQLDHARRALRAQRGKPAVR